MLITATNNYNFLNFYLLQATKVQKTTYTQKFNFKKSSNLYQTALVCKISYIFYLIYKVFNKVENNLKYAKVIIALINFISESFTKVDILKIKYY